MLAIIKNMLIKLAKKQSQITFEILLHISCITYSIFIIILIQFNMLINHKQKSNYLYIHFSKYMI